MITPSYDHDILIGEQGEQGWFSVQTIEELVTRYNLEEDIEHIIIPLTDKSGHVRRCFLLKRSFFRIQFPDGHVCDYPLAEIIEATVKYPELSLSESIHFVHKIPEVCLLPDHSGTDDEKQLLIKESYEKENID